MMLLSGEFVQLHRFFVLMELSSALFAQCVHHLRSFVISIALFQQYFIPEAEMGSIAG